MRPLVTLILAMSLIASLFGSNRKDEVPTLDLRKEFAEVYSYLTDRVRAYGHQKNDGPGEGGAVKRIDLGYGYAQAGWVAVVFDTRGEAEPDGEWSLYLDGNCLQRPNWTAAGEALLAKGLRLIALDGSERVIPTSDHFELAVPLGQMTREVVLKARKDGVFTKLPKQPKCELGVEHSEGTYGWPQHKDRGKENYADHTTEPLSPSYLMIPQELLVFNFIAEMSSWESACQERLQLRDRGDIETEVIWRSNKDEYAQIMKRFAVETESRSSGSSFDTVSGYSIEKVDSSEMTSERSWKVYTRRLRPRILDETFCYEVLEIESGRLVLGRRLFRMTSDDGEPNWSVVTF